MIYGAEDTLTLVVGAIDYHASNGKPLPTSLTLVWFIDSHPCDNKPWLVGVGFEDAVMPEAASVTTSKIGDTSTETAADLPLRAPRKPRRSIIPLPEPVRWGRMEPIEKRPFDPELARRRGCEVAAGIQLLGEL